MPTDYGGLSMARQLAAMLRDPARAVAAAKAKAMLGADAARARLTQEAERVREQQRMAETLPGDLKPVLPRGTDVKALEERMAQLLKGLRSGKGDKQRTMLELQLLRKRLQEAKLKGDALEKFRRPTNGNIEIQYGDDMVGYAVRPASPSYAMARTPSASRYRISSAVARRR